MSVLKWLRSKFSASDVMPTVRDIARDTVASLEEQTAVAEEELQKQRNGIRRESHRRRIVQAELERKVLAVTRDVLRKRVED